MAPNNALPTWGNEKTMNLNNMVLTNIQSSPYFKVNLFELKTYHEVIDEIYYKVNHLEPWEKGSRKTAGQTGMCGGVRGVGAGGIVSTAYCILYKLYTLKLTRKQVNGLITHQDSPYIRGLGFMYIRYTQPPSDLWEWYEPYLEDDEELDVKAGGGHTMNIGEMLRQWLVKLEWYATLFPRIPVPIQKDIDVKLKEWQRNHAEVSIPLRMSPAPRETKQHIPDEEVSFGEAARYSRAPDRHGSRDRVGARTGERKQTPPFNIAREIEREKERQHRRDQDARHRSRSRERKKRSSSRERHHHKSRDGRGSKSKDTRHADRDSHRGKEHKRSRSRERKRSHSRDRRRSRSPHRKSSHSDDKARDRKANRKRSRSRERRRSRSRERKRSREQTKHRHRESSFERDLKRERERQKQRLNENGK